MSIPDFYSVMKERPSENTPDEEPDFYAAMGKKEPSRTRSLISAPIKGALKELVGLGEMFSPGPVPGGRSEPFIEEMLPTQQKTAESFLERAGKILPAAALGPESLLAKGLQVGGGTLAGELAESAGLGELGQGVSEAVGMGAPGLAKIGAKQAASKLFGPTKKMAGGLTKPAALEAKRPGLGVITPERQEAVLAKMDRDTSRLVKETIDKRLPIAKQIEQGVNFKGKYTEGFSKLKHIAENANMEMNTEGLASFLREAKANFSGIPNPNVDAKKIIKEINAFFKKPTSDHGNLLKIYRDNNNKISRIFETSRATGTVRQEYVDFLKEMNRAIQKSFEDTLPAGNMWLQQFKELNKDYKAYKDASFMLDFLKDAIGQEPNLKNFQKLAYDPKIQKKMVQKFGQEGSSELIQLAKDLNMAKEAVKSIPAKEFKLWEMAFPLGLLLPGAGKLIAAVGAKKYIEYGRRGYGYFLTSPARRAAYGEALKAIQQNNLQAYIKATSDLRKAIEEEMD